MIRMLIFLGLTVGLLSGCATVRTAFIPSAQEVTKVVVSDVRHPEDSPILSFSDRDKIAAVLHFLEQRKSGWRPVQFTPPARRLNIVFYRQSEYVGVVRADATALQMPVDGSECSLELNDAEQNEFFEILGIDPAIFWSDG